MMKTGQMTVEKADRDVSQVHVRIMMLHVHHGMVIILKYAAGSSLLHSVWMMFVIMQQMNSMIVVFTLLTRITQAAIPVVWIIVPRPAEQSVMSMKTVVQTNVLLLTMIPVRGKN